MEQANNEVYLVGLNEVVIKVFWQKVCPPRAQLLVWFLAMDKLKTGNILHSLGMINMKQTLCPFCQVETTFYFLLISLHGNYGVGSLNGGE